MSTPGPPSADANQNRDESAREGTSAEVSPTNQERAGEALRAAFARLAPQGSNEWNFNGAFIQLLDKFGPEQPRARAVPEHRAASVPSRSRLLQRLGRRYPGPLRTGGSSLGGNEESTDVAEVMRPVVEALRFLSARVSALETRLEAQDVPVNGAAWLAPARELGSWTEVVAAHLVASSPGGTVIHADCGEGALLGTLAGRGVDALGVEPRGGVALRALEGGYAVVIAEIHEYLASLGAGTLGGVVLTGVVDRIPLHEVLSLLTQCRRTLARGAPIVVVSEPLGAAESRQAPEVDLVSGRPLHAATWELLLERTGFAAVAALPEDTDRDGRFALTAAVPR